MTFPVSPADGTTAAVNGILYTYNSAINSWKRNPIGISDVTAANLNIRSGSDTISSRTGKQATVATTSITAVDTWSVSIYRSSKYIVQIKQGTNFSVHEILIIQDGTTAHKTEYGVLETNGSLATFTADISSGNARLLVTMASATSATITISRELIVV